MSRVIFFYEKERAELPPKQTYENENENENRFRNRGKTTSVDTRKRETQTVKLWFSVSTLFRGKNHQCVLPVSRIVRHGPISEQCVVPRDYQLCHVILRLDSCQDLVEF